MDKVVGDTITRRTGQAKPLGQKLGRCRRAQLQLATGGIKGAVLGREAMQALEQVTTSPAWATVSAEAKKRVADALASGNTQASWIWPHVSASQQVASPSAEEEEPSAAPYWQATIERHER